MPCASGRDLFPMGLERKHSVAPTKTPHHGTLAPVPPLLSVWTNSMTLIRAADCERYKRCLDNWLPLHHRVYCVWCGGQAIALASYAPSMWSSHLCAPLPDIRTIMSWFWRSRSLDPDHVNEAACDLPRGRLLHAPRHVSGRRATVLSEPGGGGGAAAAARHGRARRAQHTRTTRSRLLLGLGLALPPPPRPLAWWPSARAHPASARHAHAHHAHTATPRAKRSLEAQPPCLPRPHALAHDRRRATGRSLSV